MESEVSFPCSQQLEIGHVLGQLNPVYTLKSSSSRVNFNIILQSTRKGKGKGKGKVVPVLLL
jgi:hypothetical protein